MGFIIGRQDGKLRGMCSVAAIYVNMEGGAGVSLPRSDEVHEVEGSRWR